jgi:cobalt-zinc-cadmium efflux system membrane fusion protein
MTWRPWIWAAAAALLLFPVLGCGQNASTSDSAKPADSQKDAPAKNDSAPPVPSDAVMLDAQMSAKIKTETLKEQRLPTLFTATGKVHFNEDQMARILAPVAGQVLQLKAKVGDVVPAGATLFVIDSREAAAAIAEYANSQKDADLAQKTYAMTQDLFAHEAASRISLQGAERDLAKAKAEVLRSQQALRVLGLPVEDGDLAAGATPSIPVTTPLKGTVIERNVTEGQFVQPDNNPLLTIADLSTVWVLADVFERDLYRVKVGQRADVVATAYPNEHFQARVSYIGDVVDPVTRTVKVRYLVVNSGNRLKPEMFASVTLFLEEGEPGVLAPATAVFTEHAENFIFVRAGKQEFVRRTVEVTPDGGGQLRVTSGIKAGETVVTEGALLLRELQKSKENQ